MPARFPMALFALWKLASAAIDDHLIKSLPGYDGPLPTRQWSGYIDVAHPNTSATTVHVHYWLVENAAKDPNAPTVVWQQGGPGGSSLIGFFTETGPLTLNDYSYLTDAHNKTGIPTVFDNPHGWHTAPANMLYVEHPAPTGFSYCSPSNDACVWDDWNQAQVNYQFYVNFFEKYPELAKNKFYMSGESYAGVLVPTVAMQFLEHRTDANKDTAPWSMTGYAIGNACPGNRVFTCTPYSGWIGAQVALDFRYGHAMISDELYGKINKACEGKWGTYDSPGGECAKLLEDPVRPCMSEAGDTYGMGGGYFLYDTCDPDLLSLGRKTEEFNYTRSEGHEHAFQTPHLPPARTPTVAEVAQHARTRQARQQQEQQERQPWQQDLRAVSPTNSGQYACGQERGAVAWLNLEDVRKAINVQTKKQSGRDYSFSTGLNYTKNWHSLLPEYKEKILPNFKVWQYSGDADPCVPTQGTQKWIYSLGYNTTKNGSWRPWQSGSGGIAGYVTNFDTPHAFSFVTVRDAGHMSPRYKPTQTLHMIKTFLSGKEL